MGLANYRLHAAQQNGCTTVHSRHRGMQFLWFVHRPRLPIHPLYECREHALYLLSPLHWRQIACGCHLRASVRPGSLDADIQQETASANDFKAFFQTHASLELLVFNGKKAEQLFRRMVADEHRQIHRHIGLPSTSPAMASLSLADKLAAWSVLKTPPVD